VTQPNKFTIELWTFVMHLCPYCNGRNIILQTMIKIMTMKKYGRILQVGGNVRYGSKSIIIGRKLDIRM